MLAILSWSAFSLEDNSTKGLLTLLNIILLTIPLVTILFTTIYIYNSAEFIELLLSQPIQCGIGWYASQVIGIQSYFVYRCVFVQLNI